jgi:hypothetical protein
MPNDTGSVEMVKSGAVSVEHTNYGTRHPLKFSNGDECLDNLVTQNGGHFCLSNTDLLMEVVLDPTWK